MGVPWERRGDRCDEYIQAMKELWTTPRNSFHGEFCDFDDAISFPNCLARPIRIWKARTRFGSSSKAIRNLEWPGSGAALGDSVSWLGHDLYYAS